MDSPARLVVTRLAECIVVTFDSVDPRVPDISSKRLLSFQPSRMAIAPDGLYLWTASNQGMFAIRSLDKERFLVGFFFLVNSVSK